MTCCCPCCPLSTALCTTSCCPWLPPLSSSAWHSLWSISQCGVCCPPAVLLSMLSCCPGVVAILLTSVLYTYIHHTVPAVPAATRALCVGVEYCTAPWAAAASCTSCCPWLSYVSPYTVVAGIRCLLLLTAAVLSCCPRPAAVAAAYALLVACVLSCSPCCPAVLLS